MTTAKSCRVCKDERRSEIDRELLRPDGQRRPMRALAELFGIPLATLSRHKTGCLDEEGAKSAADEEAGAHPAAASPGPSPTTPEVLRPGVPLDDETLALLRRKSAGGGEDPPRGTQTPTAGPAAGPRPRRPPPSVVADGRAAQVFIEDKEIGLPPAAQDQLDGLLLRGKRSDEELMAIKEYDDRIEAIADMIAAGRWEGRPSVRRLADLWCLQRNSVQHMASLAARINRASMGDGDREMLRQLAMAEWERNRELARSVLDLKAANTAQAGWDKAAGVIDPKGPQVQVLVNNPQFLVFVRGIAESLAPWPEAQRAALAWMKESMANRGQHGLEGRLRSAGDKR